MQYAEIASNPSKRDEIQWPALENLKPGNLKRTVSTIMKEWEKSLTPPPEERRNPLEKSTERVKVETPSKSTIKGDNISSQEDAIRMFSG